ncbi:MAG: MogA/MoaB family molybdenum cofactor biosynthesis protein [Desulfocurvibacter africanus]
MTFTVSLPEQLLAPGMTCLLVSDVMGEASTFSPLGQPDRPGPAVLLCHAPLPELRAGTFLDGPQGPLCQVEWSGRLPGNGTATPCHWLRILAAPQAQAGADLQLAARAEGLSLAWVTLSDKGSQGLREDTSGPAIEEIVGARYPLSLAKGFVLPDEPRALRALLTDLALVQGFDLVLTTGGTGLGPRDTTPEATLSVIEKRLPGFELAMTMSSLAKTPHGAISRAVAGTLGRTIIVNLPGSPKAVRENLQAILPALGHASEKLKGDPSDCATA